MLDAQRQWNMAGTAGTRHILSLMFAVVSALVHENFKFINSSPTSGPCACGCIALLQDWLKVYWSEPAEKLTWKMFDIIFSSILPCLFHTITSILFIILMHMGCFSFPCFLPPFLIHSLISSSLHVITCCHHVYLTQHSPSSISTSCSTASCITSVPLIFLPPAYASPIIIHEINRWSS